MNSITIAEYDPLWPEQYAEIESRVRTVFRDGPPIEVEHVGSTAVPGLAAKPIIDIDVVVPSQAGVPEAISRLGLLGYMHQGDLGIAGREAFLSPLGPVPHHLYLCACDNTEYQRHLAFRDYLRTHRDEAERYGALKRELADCSESRTAYFKGKSEFVEAALKKAWGPVDIAEYDPRWPERFEWAASGLREAFGVSLVALEHIGSTSIPGLAAKPIVDIQAVVQSLSDRDSVTPKLIALGWEQGCFALDPERRLYFKKYAAGVRAYQLHVYEPGHPVGAAHLLFRDYLRAHSDEAWRYEALKRELAVRFHTDRLAYNGAKTEYIEAVVRKAREQTQG